MQSTMQRSSACSAHDDPSHLPLLHLTGCRRYAARLRCTAQRGWRCGSINPNCAAVCVGCVDSQTDRRMFVAHAIANRHTLGGDDGAAGWLRARNGLAGVRRPADHLRRHQNDTDFGLPYGSPPSTTLAIPLIPEISHACKIPCRLSHMAVTLLVCKNAFSPRKS